MVEISFENSLIIGKVSNSTELESYFEAGIAISVFYDEEGSACPNESARIRAIVRPTRPGRRVSSAVKVHGKAALA